MDNERNFEKIVLEAFEAIPKRFREKVKNVALIVEEDVTDEIRENEGLEKGESLLGLYVGIPNSERGSSYGDSDVMPDIVTIFRKPNIEHAYETGEPLEKVVRETVWHEYAHYFGMDEGEVEQWENERKEEGFE